MKTEDVKEYYDLKRQKKDIEIKLKTLRKDFMDEMNEQNLVDNIVDDFLVSIKNKTRTKLNKELIMHMLDEKQWKRAVSKKEYQELKIELIDDSVDE